MLLGPSAAQKTKLLYDAIGVLNISVSDTPPPLDGNVHNHVQILLTGGLAATNVRHCHVEGGGGLFFW